jgi:hypothetical protein
VLEERADTGGVWVLEGDRLSLGAAALCLAERGERCGWRLAPFVVSGVGVGGRPSHRSGDDG